MKLLKKVEAIEVKRCFVASQHARGGRDKRRVYDLSKRDFTRQLIAAKRYVNKLCEKKLDLIIKSEYIPRWQAYNKCEWYIGLININEVSVWRGAAGLPVSWTKGTLKDAAAYLKKALSDGYSANIRATKAVPRILRTSLGYVKNEKILYPIVLPGNMIKNARKRLRKFKGNIDDGCARSLALTISGAKKIKAYIGVPKK